MTSGTVGKRRGCPWQDAFTGLATTHMAWRAPVLMQQVLAAELDGRKRVFALVFGQVKTRAAEVGN